MILCVIDSSEQDEGAREETCLVFRGLLATFYCGKITLKQEKRLY